MTLLPQAGLRHRLLREFAYIVVLGTPLALFLLVAAPRSKASQLLRQLNGVQVNQTHFRQVERLAGEFGDYAACVGDNCLFQFQNEWLHRLRLAPRTEFTVMVRRYGSPADPGGGSVGSMDMAMLVSSDAPGGGAIASALVFDRAEAVDGDPYQASITFGANGKAGRTVVMLAPGATGRQRVHARAFNLGCLTKLGGCKTSRDLLPEVWQGARRIETVGLEPPTLRHLLTGAGPARLARPAVTGAGGLGGPLAPSRGCASLRW